MLRPTTVCPELQQPLYIDTDINYSLDMSKFPGLDDPCHLHQPALLIATQDTISNYLHHCTRPPAEGGHTENASSTCSVNYTRNVGVKLDNIDNHIDTSAGHILEDLLTALDTYTNGLLERLITIPEIGASKSMLEPNRNTLDLGHSDLTDGPMLLRNYQQRGHVARCAQTKTLAGITELRGVPDCVRNLHSLSGLKTNIRYKRKRTQDGFESDMQKRHCIGMDTLDAGRYYGYAGSYIGYRQFPTFTSIVT